MPSFGTPIAPGDVDLRALGDTLCALGGVARVSDLGANGPLRASAGAESLFNCLFGRDALRMALDLQDDFPAVARATLLELARLQGAADNPRSEEEPGRILHEHREAGDPHVARLAQHWEFPYYGAVDSTPHWIILLGAYCARAGAALLDEVLTDRLGRRRTVRDCLVDAVAWIRRRLDDPAGGGFLWVRRATPHGIANQVWEDSADAYHYEDGALLDFSRPYAPVAVQGYAYDALLVAARLLGPTPSPEAGTPAELRRRAAALRARVLRRFWQPHLGTFAHALAVQADGSLRAARVVASSPGHLLASRILDGADAAALRERLIARLMADDLLAGAGIRTKSTAAPRFRAGSYHNGSVWPMDSGVIADGLRRHGRVELADELERRILRACALVGGFPEFFRGDPDGAVRVNVETVDALVDGQWNRLEQPPQTHQGWTATRIWRIARRVGAIRWPAEDAWAA